MKVYILIKYKINNIDYDNIIFLYLSQSTVGKMLHLVGKKNKIK